MYKLSNSGVIRISDGAYIPNDPNNRDWRKYQKWTTKGNIALQPDDQNTWLEIRNTRNLILQSSDWVLLIDSPLTTAEKNIWKTYRQKLRDIPQDFSEPSAVIWPDRKDLPKAEAKKVKEN